MTVEQLLTGRRRLTGRRFNRRLLRQAGTRLGAHHARRRRPPEVVLADLATLK